MKNILIGLLLFISPLILSAQEYGTKGTEFWLAYMENLSLALNGPPQFSIYVSSNSAGTATVTAPATGLTLDFNYTEDEVLEIVLPDAIYYGEGSEDVENLGLKITTSTPSNVYAVHYRLFFSESTIVFPVEILDEAYIVSAAVNDSPASGAPSSFVVLATEDNTEIEIIPSALTFGLRPANVPFTINLNAGQTYQVQATEDLTGTAVRSTNGNKIAVFGGARQAVVACNGAADNHLYDQLLPGSVSAQDYALIPFQGQGASLFKILALEDDTELSIGDQVITTLDQGESFEGLYSEAQMLSANKGVHVMQFNPAQECNDSELGDPNMLQLFSRDYWLKEVRFRALDGFAGSTNAFSIRYLTLLSESENVNNITLDGQDISNSFQPFPDESEYSYARIEISASTHFLNAPGGVQAYTYGFGDFDAYTFHLGFEAEDLTAVNETDHQHQVYYQIGPNPTEGFVNIQLNQAIEKVEVFDLKGRLLKTVESFDEDAVVDISSFTAGLYIFKIKSENSLIVEKIVKQSNE